MVMQNAGGLIMVAAAIFVVPALVSKFIVGGDWRQVAISYALWFGFLTFTLLLPGGGKWSEKFGWLIIISMFLSIAVVPALTLIQRVVGWGIENFG